MLDAFRWLITGFAVGMIAYGYWHERRYPGEPMTFTFHTDPYAINAADIAGWFDLPPSALGCCPYDWAAEGDFGFWPVGVIGTIDVEAAVAESREWRGRRHGSDSAQWFVEYDEPNEFVTRTWDPRRP